MQSVDSLLPPVSSPYYIVAPPYTRASAGIKVLHVLAHALKSRGFETYLVLNSKMGDTPATHPAFSTPFLDKRIAKLHFTEGRTPVVIYPETMHGNPLSAPYVVRYILNYAGHLGGPKTYSETDHLIYYSQDLRGSDSDALCLFIPVSNPNLFRPPPPGTVRKGVAVYAGKYRDFHNGEYFGVTGPFTEITRDRPDSQSLKELIHILQTSEVLYCYENSAITLEAILCGCPVVLLKNEHFKKMIAENELTTNGISFSSDLKSIEAARAGVAKYRENYIACFDKFWAQLDEFIGESQARASGIEYKEPILMDRFPISMLPLREKLRITAHALTMFFDKNGFWPTANLILKPFNGKMGRFAFRQTLSREYYSQLADRSGKS